MLELLLGWRGSGSRGSGLGERVGWTLTLLSSRSILAGRDGRLRWHRGQIRRRHQDW